MKSLTYIELDITYCALSYGVAPCAAAIGVTGADKCFNSFKTCQDRTNFDESIVTLRFAKPADYLPDDISAIPSVDSIELTSARVSLGDDIGERGTLDVSFIDHKHNDVGSGFDKYHAGRSYEPFSQGTFWGKFRARHPFVRGSSLRLILGETGQALADMETRHYYVESMDGPDDNGLVHVVAKDVLKIIDDDRVQCPRLSGGFLSGPVVSSDAETDITLSPAGIGATYPSAGIVSLGGKELCTFTRSSDVLTLFGTPRGKFGTDAQAHAAEERVQVVQFYNPQPASDILSQLLIDFGLVPSAYVPLAEWQEECNTYLGVNYSVLIASPTGVSTLVSELIKAAGLVVWWDDLARLIRLRVLRGALTSDEQLSEANILKETFRITEQPEKRLSRVWTYFSQKSPVANMEDPENYGSVAETIDAAAEEEYGDQAIEKIYTRWIPQFGKLIAQRINSIRLSRFRDPPRKFNFGVLRGGGVALGGVYSLGFWPLQDASGARSDVTIQITKAEPNDDVINIEAEEVVFTTPADFDLVVSIDVSVDAFNARLAYDSLYPPPDATDTVFFRIEPGVVIGSIGIGTPAFNVGDWPEGPTIIITNKGRIQGIGGRGGQGQANGVGGTGQKGGTGLYTRYPVDLNNADGDVWAGGGGGGGGGRGHFGVQFGRGGGGGGGQGKAPSQGGLRGSGNSGGHPGQPGDPSGPGVGGVGGPNAGSGGAGGLSGAAGKPGSAGNDGGGGAGGASGNAIDGMSYVTFVGTGDVRGSLVN